MFLGLDGLGRRPLRLKSFHQDRSLGLGPLGRLAFSAFLLLAALLLPYAIVGAHDVRSATPWVTSSSLPSFSSCLRIAFIGN